MSRKQHGSRSCGSRQLSLRPYLSIWETSSIALLAQPKSTISATLGVAYNQRTSTSLKICHEDSSSFSFEFHQIITLVLFSSNKQHFINSHFRRVISFLFHKIFSKKRCFCKALFWQTKSFVVFCFILFHVYIFNMSCRTFFIIHNYFRSYIFRVCICKFLISNCLNRRDEILLSNEWEKKKKKARNYSEGSLIIPSVNFKLETQWERNGRALLNKLEVCSGEKLRSV